MLTLKQKNSMKKWADEVAEDISIICIAECPICGREFDAEDKDDSNCINVIRVHIEFDHTYNDLQEQFINLINYASTMLRKKFIGR